MKVYNSNRSGLSYQSSLVESFVLDESYNFVRSSFHLIYFDIVSSKIND